MFGSFATLPRKNLRKETEKCLLATALYDNTAESTDELAFCKGDILTVLEQNPNGLVGWWLCSLRGKCGICPGNRLRMLGHVVCNATQGAPTASPTQSRHVRQASDPLRSSFSAATPSPFSSHQPGSAGSSVGNVSAKDRSKDNLNKVIIPHKVGDVYLYDVPDSRMQTPSPTPKKVDGSSVVPLGTQHAIPTYDTPRPHRFVTSTPSNRRQTPSPAAKMMYDVPKGGEDSYDVPRSHLATQRHSTGELPSMLDYDIPRHHHGTAKVDTSCYDVPPSTGTFTPSAVGPATDATYDVPQVSQCRVGDSNRSSCASMSSSSSGPSPVYSGNSLTPSLSLSSLGGNSSSNRSSLEHPHELYDIPRPIATSQELLHGASSTPTAEALPPKGTPTAVAENVYDVPPQVTRDCGTSDAASDARSKRLSDPTPGATNPTIEGRELPLELDAAMDMLVKLQQNVQAATQKLFNVASALVAKRKAPSEVRSYDIQSVCGQVRNSTQEFLDFANGALVNSSKGSDVAVCQRLNKLLRPLSDANAIVHSTCRVMESNSWAVVAGEHLPPEFDRLVFCARTLTEDVRQVACFIQGNSTLIFRRAKPPVPSNGKAHLDGTVKAGSPANLSGTPQYHSGAPPVSLPPKTRERPVTTPLSAVVQDGSNVPEKLDTAKLEENLYENDSRDWVDDYDYVNLESKEIFQKKNEEFKAGLPEELRKSFDNLLKESLVQVDDSMKGKVIHGGLLSIVDTATQDVRLDANDRQVVCFYYKQLDTHSVYLNNAIQAFLLTVERNQPPKIFVDHSKFVILGAHKLVYIGDTVHRNVSHPEVRHQVQRCADELCDALKTTVQRIKTAAMQFPSVLAVQEMVDSVVDVSHAASCLKNVVAQFVN